MSFFFCIYLVFHGVILLEKSCQKRGIWKKFKKQRMTLQGDLSIEGEFKPSAHYVITMTALSVYWSIKLSFCFTFHIPGQQHPGGFRGLYPPQIFKSNKILERPIINGFPCAFVFALNLKIMLRHCRYKILLVFSAFVNFNVKLSQNKLCSSCTTLDAPCL